MVHPVWHLWMAEAKATSSSERGGCGICRPVLGQITLPPRPKSHHAATLFSLPTRASKEEMNSGS